MQVSRITLAAVGDIMLGDHPVCFGHGIRATMDRVGCEHFVKDVLEVLNPHDVVMGNLECVISDIGYDENVLSSAEMRGSQESVKLLKMCGFNVLSVANNHMLQHGPDAFNDTVSLLKKSGIDCVGCREDTGSNVVTIHSNDLRVSFVAYSLRPEQYGKRNNSYARTDEEHILRQIGGLKNSLPNHSIVVSIHWGEEYLHVPSYEQVRFAHKMVDSGATLIVGHHPHVLQGIEVYKSSLIAYSLGNFVFDSWQNPTRESAILKCTLGKDGILGHTVVPIYIRSDYSLTSRSERHNKAIRAHIEAYSRKIAEADSVASIEPDRYAALASSAYRRYRIECYLYFLSHLLRYKPSIVLSSVRRSLMRRCGLA